MKLFERVGTALRTAKYGLLTIIGLQTFTIVVLLSLLAQTNYLTGQSEPLDRYDIADAIDLSGIEAELASVKREAQIAADASERAARDTNMIQLAGVRCN